MKAMPTFFLMKNKEVVNKIIGVNPDELKKLVESSADPVPSETQIIGTVSTVWSGKLRLNLSVCVTDECHFILAVIVLSGWFCSCD
jgi:hypothetical protein